MSSVMKEQGASVEFWSDPRMLMWKHVGHVQVVLVIKLIVIRHFQLERWIKATVFSLATSVERNK